jgi:hypothetical protein
MFYDPRTKSPFADYVAAWMEGESNLADPFEQFITFHRAEAAYLLKEHRDTVRSREIRRLVNRLEALIATIRESRLSYTQAAEVGTWSHGTIKNKASSGDLDTVNGEVALHQIPISPDASGLHAWRFVQKVEDARQAERRTAVAEDNDREEIRKRVAAARSRVKQGRRGQRAA